MAENCVRGSCTVKGNQAALVWAPCGSHVFDDNGTLIPPAAGDLYDEIPVNPADPPPPPGSWLYEDARSVTFDIDRTTTNTRKLRCKNNCDTDINGHTMNLELCLCFENLLHRNFYNPKESCEIDFMYFPNPKICAMPDPQTDFFIYGTAIGGPDQIGGSAEDTEGQILTITMVNCGDLFCLFGMQDDEVLLQGLRNKGITAATAIEHQEVA